MGAENKNVFQKITAGALSCFLALTCTACSETTEGVSSEAVSNTYEFTSVNVRGNTNGNIANLGLGVAQGDKIFFTNPCEEYYVYTVENSEVKKAFDDFDDIFLQMNLIDSSLYYVSYYYSDMCFYDLNGGVPGSLSDVSTYAMLVDGDYLYCIDATDGHVKRWRFGSDDADGEKLGEHKAYTTATDVALTMSVTDEAVFYAAADDGYGVYAVDLETKAETKIIDKAVSKLIAENDRVYYVLKEDGLLYSCLPDGRDIKCMTQKSISAFNLNDKYIYYSSAEEGLFRLDLNDGNEKKLTDLKNIAYINLMNEYIFAYSGVEGEVMVATSKLFNENGDELGSWTASTADTSSQ